MKKLLLCLFIPVTLLSANSLFSQENNDSREEEITSKRTLNSKHFKGASGSITAEISTRSIHYRDNDGKWQDINTEIIPSNNPEYNFENSANNLKSYYSNNGVLVKTEAGSIKIGVNPSLVSISTNGDEKTIDTQSLSESTISGSTVVYKNAFQSGDIEYIVENDKIKNNLILKTLPAQLSAEDGFLGFSENLELPKGWFIAHNEKAIEKSIEIEGHLIIKNEHGVNMMEIPAPIVFDSSKEPVSNLGLTKNILYKVVKNKKGYRLITMVPLNWLKNSNRVYPITIDPTVTLPGTLGGWQGNVSGNVNSGGFVFVGILSAEDHRGWIQFDISSIPIGSIITLVETELFVNGVGGAAAETLNINDVTGTKGNYGANDPAVYTDFGNGLYTSFTALGAATYGYYNLGTNAIANLVTDLPSGTFQYAIDMPVQTSNWKRFTANLSNLRVTYNNLPCTLPIPIGTLDSTICNGDSFVFNGTTYNGTNNTGTEIINITGCDSMVIITVTELVAITPGTLDSTICNGASFVFNGTTYNGTNNTGIETLTTAAGCDSLVTVTITEMAPITGILNSTICNGESFVFNGTTYDGTNNTGTEIFTAANGCDSVVTVTITELATLDTITTTNNNIITANLVGATYQWIDCNNNNDIIIGETSQSFTATANGDYAVIVTVGSCSDTSACVNIATVGIDKNNFEKTIILSPNPTTGNVNINFGQALNDGSIIISDVTGKQVYSLESLNKQILNLDINNFSKGIYFVKIQNNNQQKVIKLIKQ